MKRGKKYLETAKLVERGNLYDKAEAIALVKKCATAKFDETIEAHIRTGCDGRHADQQIRGAVVLPHGTGKKVRILVFAKDAKAQEAIDAGADYVGAEELIPRIQNEGWFDYDVVVATPNMMGVVGRLGRVLGPKGLMPNPKAGTVTMDIAKAIADIKAGKIEYRLDKTNIIHVPLGKASFTDEQIADNFQTLIDAINKARPAAVKGQFLKSVVLTSTMGPGVKINPLKLAKQLIDKIIYRNYKAPGEILELFYRQPGSMRLAHWCFGAIVKKFGKVSGFLIENKKKQLKTGVYEKKDEKISRNHRKCWSKKEEKMYIIQNDCVTLKAMNKKEG